MYSNTKKEILAELRRDTNGAVVGTMLEMLGEEKYINYGVTVATIKKVAAHYAPNHALAMEMFNSQIRELKLCAIYVDTPSEVTTVQMNEWSNSFISQEITEHCCSMLFFGAKDALTTAQQWMGEKTYAALLIAAKRAKIAFQMTEQDLYLEIIEKICAMDNESHTFTAKCQLLVSLSKKDAQMKEYISKLPLTEKVKEEINWQIEP